MLIKILKKCCRMAINNILCRIYNLWGFTPMSELSNKFTLTQNVSGLDKITQDHYNL